MEGNKNKRRRKRRKRRRRIEYKGTRSKLQPFPSYGMCTYNIIYRMG